MVYQVTADENNIITGWSIGGYIPNGIDVPEIPQEIIESDDYSKWCYTEEKGFYENPDYITPDTLTPAKEIKIAESKEKLADWLQNNPMQHTDGKYYSVTTEKQALLNGNLASYERAKSMGVVYDLKWNATEQPCETWSYTDLLTLSLNIAAYVAPKVSKQQLLEVQIRNCETMEELEAIVIDYDEE